MPPTAILFPGQGSLTADAGAQARAECPELVERALGLIGCDPFERAADSTQFAQPAIFLASTAGWRRWQREHDAAELCAMAGHSLGELSALAAAGALDTADALWLVVLRGRLMHEAALAAPDAGGMVAVLGAEPQQAAELAARHSLVVANDNAPGQVVLSGATPAIEALTESAREQDVKAIVLDVRGAFHSPAVAAAREPFLAALEDVPWSRPRVAVVSGLTAAPFGDFARELADALVAPVRWREAMAALRALGARAFTDVGPGRVLARLVARNLPKEASHALAG